ncbi:class I SAM-dependent methyltransferase [Shewanella waksmanii]|uniref:class I SAM-dependent methyltransferase n=1 Tax=Shewanella waksmanii TaxID=213783 RepID=UPI003736D41A
MKPLDIAHAYNKLTHLWTDSGFNLNNGIVQHERALSFLKHKVKPSPSTNRTQNPHQDSSANTLRGLDVGCGCTGRLTDLLLQQGFAVTGLDISSEMIRLAKQYYAGKQDKARVSFIEADICQMPLHEQYDFISAWDSIWHIPLQSQQQVISHLVTSLKPGGVLIFSFGGTTEAGEHVDDAMGQAVYYSSLGTQGFIDLVSELGCQLRHLEFDQHPELHAYMIVEKVA